MSDQKPLDTGGYLPPELSPAARYAPPVPQRDHHVVARTAHLFRQLIRDNPKRYPVGGPIAAQTEIHNRFGVSRGSAAKVVQELARTNDLDVAPGRQSIVLPPPPPTEEQALDEVQRAYRQLGRAISQYRRVAHPAETTPIDN